MAHMHGGSSRFFKYMTPKQMQAAHAYKGYTPPGNPHSHESKAKKISVRRSHASKY